MLQNKLYLFIDLVLSQGFTGREKWDTDGAHMISTGDVNVTRKAAANWFNNMIKHEVFPNLL